MKAFWVVLTICSMVLCPSWRNNVYAGGDDYGLSMVLDEYNKRNELLKKTIAQESNSAEDIGILRKNVESYHEEIYLPRLNSLRDIICQNVEDDLLLKFLKILITTSNSADEAPRWTLGEIYICQPEIVSKAIRRLQSHEQSSILNQLDFGFSNIIYGDEKYHIELREKLDLMIKGKNNK